VWCQCHGIASSVCTSCVGGSDDSIQILSRPLKTVQYDGWNILLHFDTSRAHSMHSILICQQQKRERCIYPLIDDAPHVISSVLNVFEKRMRKDILENARQVLRVQHNICTVQHSSAQLSKNGDVKNTTPASAGCEYVRACPTGISCFRDSAAASPAMKIAYELTIGSDISAVASDFGLTPYIAKFASDSMKT
jgi:hypothetical protein